MSQRRRATHAGSWYSNRESELHQRMDGWLAAAKAEHRPAKAIISPHAGYEYCGSCAAYAYKQIDPSSVDRVFILGPSHHYPLGGCALTICDSYETPFYDLRIDQKTSTELFETGMFERMSIDVDEDEHSIEMQLPYLAKVMESRRNDPAFRIIPILVGSLSVAKEAEYGRLLSKYLDAPRTLVIASSDFCHWGSRFSYTHYKRECGEIFESITQLDRDGIDAIESLEPTRFAAYLRETRNTICGRHPIGVLLNAIAALPPTPASAMTNGHTTNGSMNGHAGTSNGVARGAGRLKFLHYSQSNRCMSMRDSSVSYAAASFVI